MMVGRRRKNEGNIKKSNRNFTLSDQIRKKKKKTDEIKLEQRLRAETQDWRKESRVVKEKKNQEQRQERRKRWHTAGNSLEKESIRENM